MRICSELKSDSAFLPRALGLAVAGGRGRLREPMALALRRVRSRVRATLAERERAQGAPNGLLSEVFRKPVQSARDSSRENLFGLVGCDVVLGDMLARRRESRGAPMGPSFVLAFAFAGGGAFDVVASLASSIASKGLASAGVGVCAAEAEAIVVCTCASLFMSSFDRVVPDGAADVAGGGAEEDDEDDPP